MPQSHSCHRPSDYLRHGPLVVVDEQNLAVELLVLFQPYSYLRYRPLVVVGEQNLAVELLVLAQQDLLLAVPLVLHLGHVLPGNRVLALDVRLFLVVVGAENLAVELVAFLGVDLQGNQLPVQERHRPTAAAPAAAEVECLPLAQSTIDSGLEVWEKDHPNFLVSCLVAIQVDVGPSACSMDRLTNPNSKTRMPMSMTTRFRTRLPRRARRSSQALIAEVYPACVGPSMNHPLKGTRRAPPHLHQAAPLS